MLREHRSRQAEERLALGPYWEDSGLAALALGVPPRVVMEVLGHSQFSITMDLYSHVMPSALREAADAMDRALGGKR